MPPLAATTRPIALGLRLQLLVGETLPLPPAPLVLDAFTSLQVTSDESGQDGFSITFSLTKELVEFDLLASNQLSVGRRVVIGVILGAVPEVLIDGVITHHQLAASAQPGASSLTVMGRDISEAMNFEERNQSFPNQPDHVIVQQIVARYTSRFGVIADASPALRTPTMVNEIPSQTETDLAAIRRMALRNGFVFYVEPTFVGTSRAYFGPQVRGGAIQPAMSVDMGSSSNVSQLSFSNDALATSSPSGTFIEPFSKTSIPIPPLPPLKVPPLSLPQPALRTTVVRDVANRDPSGALVGALRRQAEQPDPVQGTGQVDTARYGAVLRARKLVGVRGVGFGYGGLYHVRSVTHSITRNSYTQQFRIQREGVGSTTPAVMP